MHLEKFAFRIRTRNGVLLERLNIQAVNQDEARAKLIRMYPLCEIIESSQVTALPSSLFLRSFQNTAKALSS